MEVWFFDFAAILGVTLTEAVRPWRDNQGSNAIREAKSCRYSASEQRWITFKISHFENTAEAFGLLGSLYCARTRKKVLMGGTMNL